MKDNSSLVLPPAPGPVRVPVGVRREVEGGRPQHRPVKILQFVRKQILLEEESFSIPEIVRNFRNFE